MAVLQEATATGDPELLGLVLEGRDMQRYSSRVAGIPTLLAKLKEASCGEGDVSYKDSVVQRRDYLVLPVKYIEGMRYLYFICNVKDILLDFGLQYLMKLLIIVNLFSCNKG